MDDPDDVLRTFKERRARRQARENVETWGQQSASLVTLALVEELGELAAEIVPDESPDRDDQPVDRTWFVLDDAASLGAHTQDTLEDLFEDDAGEPVDPDDRPVVCPEREDLDVDAVRAELYDLMALMYQLDWALYQGVRERDRFESSEIGGDDQ